MISNIKQQVKAAGSSVSNVLKPATWKEKGLRWSIAMASFLLILMMLILAIYWSRSPDLFDVRDQPMLLQETASNGRFVAGSVTTATLIKVSSSLLDKPGGYLSNDVTPPSVFLDNMPNWEFGVLVQVRDLARALRNEMSRSQSQSLEDKDLMVAEPQFSINNSSWIFPSAEGSYRKGIEALESYLGRLQDEDATNAQFYTRADNLRNWLQIVEKRLGGLSQRLSASVGQMRINTDLAGDAEATHSTPTPEDLVVKTPWTKIDDNFFEARGAAWALLHFLKAVEIDFEPVLRKKNAVVSLRQIIRELESTQDSIWSPIILNGSGFGTLANHSLVMASYISRANAAIIDLRNLLADG